MLFRNHVITALSLISLAAVVLAGPPKELPMELVRLQKLAGQWKGTAILVVGKDTTMFPITMNLRKLIDGDALLAEFRDQNRPGEEFHRASLFGYETSTGNINMLTVTNGGEAHVFTGSWKLDQKNTLQMYHVGGGGLVETRRELMIVAASNREILIREIVTQNNKHESTFEARLRR